MEHAILAPSSASRIVQCAGSLALTMMYPEPEDSPASIEGRLAHSVNLQMLYGNLSPHGATEEMLEGAELWCDLLKPYMASVGDMPWLHCEQKVDCSVIHSENWGTPDAWHYDKGKCILRIWDYKFGHRYVDPFENWQMINYAAGILAANGVTELIGELVTVEMTIVQPRSYHKDGPVRTWRCKASELNTYFDILRHAYEEALSPDARTVSGKECRDCSARHVCSTLHASVYDTVQIVGVPVPFDLSPHALGRELYLLTSAQEALEARISGLQNEVLGRIKQGVNVPGWMTEQGKGREKWSKPVEEVIELGALMGVDVAKPTVITPKQAIKAGLPADVVASYTETPTGEINLVADDMTRSRKIFGEVLCDK